MNNVVWTYWEIPKGVPAEPAYVTLCRWTMLHNLRASCLVCVTPGNLDQYLPGMTAQLAGVQAHDRGRMDRLRRLFRGDPRSLAIKCDILRANLLMAHGGIWIDADAVVLNDLSRYHELLQRKEFFIVKRESHGKSHVSVNFYGSRPGATIISRYVDAQRRQYQQRSSFDFTAMGDVTLNPIVEELPELATLVPEREVQPVTFEESEAKLLSRTLEPDDVLTGQESVFMLYHGIFKQQLRGQSIEQLYRGDLLVSKIFRRALPEPAFRSFHDRFKGLAAAAVPGLHPSEGNR